MTDAPTPFGQLLCGGIAQALQAGCPETVLVSIGQPMVVDSHAEPRPDVLLVREEGADRRSSARAVAYGVNATGLLVMVAVFATTHVLAAPLEVAVAGGTTMLSQKVLEAVFGDQAVRRLAETAKEDLDGRIQALMASELLRYHALLDSLDLDPDAPRRLREVAERVQAARADGLPAAGSRVKSDPALLQAEDRPALAAPTLRQVPYRQGDGGDVLEAELVEPPMRREERR